MSIVLMLYSIDVEEYERLISGEVGIANLSCREQECIDKAWKPLYPLLADGRMDDPLRAAKAIGGDLFISTADDGYPPPYSSAVKRVRVSDTEEIEYEAPGIAVNSPSLVRELAQDLLSITDEELARKAAQLAEDAEFGEIIKPYKVNTLALMLKQLQEIYSAAALEGLAMVLQLV